MQVRVSPEEYDCLLHHVRLDSPAYQCLKLAAKLYGLRPLPDEYAIECDLAAAETLLTIARKHCRSAATKLENTVRELIRLSRKI